MRLEVELFYRLPLEEMKTLVKAFVFIIKRGEIWGQKYLSTKVYRDVEGFSGAIYYYTPKVAGQ